MAATEAEFETLSQLVEWLLRHYRTDASGGERLRYVEALSEFSLSEVVGAIDAWVHEGRPRQMQAPPAVGLRRLCLQRRRQCAQAYDLAAHIIALAYVSDLNSGEHKDAGLTPPAQAVVRNLGGFARVHALLTNQGILRASHEVFVACLSHLLTQGAKDRLRGRPAVDRPKVAIGVATGRVHR